MRRWSDAPVSRTVRVAALFLAVAAAGCAGGMASLPAAEQLHAAGAAEVGMDVGALRRGRIVLVTECAACHRLFLPEEYPPEQWRGIVGRMASRASLDAGQAADLELYLTAASRTAARKKGGR